MVKASGFSQAAQLYVHDFRTYRFSIRGEGYLLSDVEFQAIAEAIINRKKDAVLNIRINKQDLDSIKKKAKKLGVRYQTLIAEIIHKVAM